MKIALITDTHWGVRGDSAPFLDYQKQFLDKIFFYALDKANIKTIIHLGDLVDRRKYINFSTSQRMRQDFLDKLKGKEVYFIAGNHDVYHRSTNSTNVYNELFQGYDFKFYTKASEVIINDQTFLFVPWINDENKDETLELIRNTKAQVVFGHLELSGFEMNKGQIVDHGMDKSIFDKFDMVMSGHFHHKSSRGNIHYLGAPFEMTWADYQDDKGFHVYDTETRKLIFIKNTFSLFHKIFYNDEGKNKNDIQKELDKLRINNVYCKVIVENKTNPYLFDFFSMEMEKKNPLDLKIVEAQTIFSTNNQPIQTVDDTLTILKRCVDEMDVTANKQELESLMIELYNQAQVSDI